MKVEYMTSAEYSNTYKVTDESGKIAGTVTHYIAGRYCGMVVVNTWSAYGKREIRKAWTAYRKGR